MPDPVLIIPGTQATALKDDAGRLMAFGSLNPHGIGSSVRIESSFRAVGVQADVLWFNERSSPRAALTLDVTSAFLCDLAGC